jgi:pyridoxal phosphate enzyme (YggS family)
MRAAKQLSEQRPAHLPPLNICLQVNINQPPTKLAEVTALAEYCTTLPRLKIRGLMTIPLPKETFQEQRVEFAKLVTLFHALNEKKFQLDTLSIGMSKDMKAAIAEGATLVRVGTAIFGARQQ